MKLWPCLLLAVTLLPPAPTGLRVTGMNAGAPDPLMAYNATNYVVYDAGTNYSAVTYQWALANTGQPSQAFVWGANGWTTYGAAEPAITNASLHAVEAWTLCSNSTVTICLIDSGIDLTHPDLGGIWSTNCFMAQVVYGSNGVETGVHTSTNVLADIMDSNGHGTEMAGLIAATRGNGRGISGLAPGAKLLVAKTFFDPDESAAALAWAITQHPRVICCAWGSDYNGTALYAQFAAARAAGILCVCAAIDQPRDYNRPGFHDYPIKWKQSSANPGGLDNILAVTVTMENDTLLPGGAGYGNLWIDFGAPCRRLPTTYKDGGYVYVSGTSGATAEVTACSALLMTQFPNENYQQIIQRLRGSCDAGPAGDLITNTIAGGRVNLYRAMLYRAP